MDPGTARRLELGADVIDDLANGAWVASDEDRDRLFAVEAQIWRIAQATRKASEQAAALLPFLDRSLRAVRSNVALCVKLGVCEDEEGVGYLEGIVRELDTAISDLSLLPRASMCSSRATASERSISPRSCGQKGLGEGQGGFRFDVTP